MGHEQPQYARLEVCHLGPEDLEPRQHRHGMDKLENDGESQLNYRKPLVSPKPLNIVK